MFVIASLWPIVYDTNKKKSKNKKNSFFIFFFLLSYLIDFAILYLKFFLFVKTIIKFFSIKMNFVSPRLILFVWLIFCFFFIWSPIFSSSDFFYLVTNFFFLGFFFFFYFLNARWFFFSFFLCKPFDRELCLWYGWRKFSIFIFKRTKGIKEKSVSYEAPYGSIKSLLVFKTIIIIIKHPHIKATPTNTKYQSKMYGHYTKY